MVCLLIFCFVVAGPVEHFPIKMEEVLGMEHQMNKTAMDLDAKEKSCCVPLEVSP